MPSNIIYLFICGLLLSSGPCLSLCAPVLISYTATAKSSFKKSFISYLTFSACKMLSYVILGLLCVLGVNILNSKYLGKYIDIIYIILGSFIFFIGVTLIFGKNKTSLKFCSWIHKGNIRNVGILGLLIGLSPCIPLLGILNYIVIVSNSSIDAIVYSFTFGLGTTLSPLLIFIMLSGKAANFWTNNPKIKTLTRVICALILLFFGVKTILTAAFP